MTTKWLTRLLLFSLLCAVAMPSTVAAQMAADTYKAKCAACHGADGMGKPAMKTKDLGSAAVFVATRPMNSSISFGLLPAA